MAAVYEQKMTTSRTVMDCLTRLPAMTCGRHGWLFLLQRLQGQHCLFVGCNSPDTIEAIGVFSGNEVEVIDAAPGADLPALLTAYDDGQFDAVIVDFVHALPAQLFRTKGQLSSFIEGITRLVAADGYLYMAMQNGLSPKQFLKNLHKINWITKAGWWADGGLKRLKGTFSNNGFKQFQLHPLTIHSGVIDEVLPESGYQSFRNSLLRRERIKEQLLGARGIRWLASGYAVVADRRVSGGLVDRFIDDLCRANILDPARRAGYGLNHCLLLNGKAIISLGCLDSADSEIVAVLPLDQRSARRRLKELEMIRYLQTFPSRVSKRIPSAYGPRVIEGCLYFPIQAIPGMSVELVFPGLEQATRNAADFLLDLSFASKSRVELDEETYQKLFGRLFTETKERADVLVDLLDKIEGSVRKLLSGKSLDMVFMHGDFKMENMILDCNSLEINGVIDWELADKEGLPLLDLLYLITYNKIVVTGIDQFAVIRQFLLEDKFTDEEQHLLNQYREQLDIDGALYEALLAMFIIHHLCVRLTFDLRHVDAVKLIGAILGKLDSRLTDYLS